MQQDTFRILSLDGGGLKGLFTAKFLADIETDLDVQIGDHFDLIAGTSTGAIIALGLAFRLPASDILKFYREKGPQIFDAPGYAITKAKYQAEPLRAALQEVLGDRTIGDARTRLVIPAFNIQRREVKLFKTRHSRRFLRDWKLKAVDVAMASAAAPTYLPSFVNDSHIEYVDGGIWANNPSLIALVEAITVLGIDRSKISLLSLGTTRETVRMDAVKTNGGRLSWGPQVADIFIGASSSAAEAMSEHLLRDNNDADSTRYHRINPLVAAGEFKLDRLSQELIALAAREAEHASRKLRGTFFASKAAPFEPYKEQNAA